jgi:hypothetical protein
MRRLAAAVARPAIGALGGAIAAVVVGKATALVGSSCLLCDPAAAGTVGAIYGAVASFFVLRD